MDNWSIYHIDECFVYIMYRQIFHIKYRQRYVNLYVI